MSESGDSSSNGPNSGSSNYIRVRSKKITNSNASNPRADYANVNIPPRPSMLGAKSSPNVISNPSEHYQQIPKFGGTASENSPPGPVVLPNRGRIDLSTLGRIISAQQEKETTSNSQSNPDNKSKNYLDLSSRSKASNSPSSSPSSSPPANSTLITNPNNLSNNNNNNINNNNSNNPKICPHCHHPPLLISLSEHLQHCAALCVPCGLPDPDFPTQTCPQLFPRGEMDLHQRLCPYQPTEACPNTGCAHVSSNRSKGAHAKVCVFRVQMCPQGCGERVVALRMAQHLEECLVGCSAEVFEKWAREAKPEEVREMASRKINFQHNKIKTLERDLESLQRSLPSEHGEFKGIYFVGQTDERWSQMDSEFLRVQKLSKSPNFSKHLRQILLEESHPFGCTFGRISHNIQERCKAMLLHPSNKDVYLLSVSIQQSLEELSQSIFMTWPQIYTWSDFKLWLHNFTISQNYSSLWPVLVKKNEFLDVVLMQRLQVLQDYKPSDLDIEEKYCSKVSNNLSFNDPTQFVFSSGALNLLEKLPSITFLSEKLDLLVGTVHYICNSHLNFAVGPERPTNPLNADDLLPMLCYVLIKGKIKNIYAELNMITSFPANESSLSSGMTGYSLSVFQAALEHISTLEPLEGSSSPRLSLPTSPSANSLSMSTASLRVSLSPARSNGLDISDTTLYSIFQITKDDIVATYPCHYPILTKKGTLMISQYGIYFLSNNRDQKFQFGYEEIWSFKKGKFTFFDNAIDITVMKQTGASGSDFMDIHKPDSFVNIKLLSVEARSECFFKLCIFHQKAQSQLARPTSVALADPAQIMFEDPILEVEFSRVKEAFLSGICTVPTREVALKLASYLLYLEFGDYVASRHKTGFFKDRVRDRVAPRDWRQKLSDEELAKEYSRLVLLPPEIVKIGFVSECRGLVARMMEVYGALSVFFVREKKNEKLEPHLVVISEDYFIKLDLASLDVIFQCPRTDIDGWVEKEDFFTINFGHQSSSSSITLRTLTPDLLRQYLPETHI